MLDDKTRLGHIRDAIKEIEDFIKNIVFEEFEKDRKLQLAIVHLIGVIGEASNKVSDEIQENYEQIPWKDIIGMRNRLIHKYFDINLKIVWQTITSDLPLFLKEIHEILKIY